MTIGVALLLIAAGAILRFAISTVSTHGIDLHTIGDILMIVGVIGLLLWLIIWAPRARARRSAGPAAPPADAEPARQDPYYRPGEHEPYRPDGPYRDGERTYPYPR